MRWRVFGVGATRVCGRDLKSAGVPANNLLAKRVVERWNNCAVRLLVTTIAERCICGVSRSAVVAIFG